MTTAIDIQDLSKTYRSGLLGGSRVQALNHVNLSIPAGKIFGLLGPNGAGKTTLIKILLGIVHATAGKAFIFNQPNYRQSTRMWIGYLPENFHVARHHTGISALYFMGRLSRLSDSTIQAKLPELIELVGLKGRETELVRTYSKGMKQRLGLAQALLNDPKVLFLDEPTDGLDPLGRHHVRQCIEKLREKGTTIFINSHILQEVELICDQFAVMARGNVVASGTLSELLSKAAHASFKTIVTGVGNQKAVDDLRSSIADKLPLVINRVQNTSLPVELVSRELDSVSEETVLPNDHPHSNHLYENWQFELASAEQPDIDFLVDTMRASSISVSELIVVRPKLEQIFMDLVKAPAHPTYPS